MKQFEIRNHTYELIKEEGNCFQLEELKEKITDYFDSYDYILGDYAYEKLRLKGFNEKTNKNYRSINAIEGVEKYLKDYCAYGAKYFLLKKVK